MRIYIIDDRGARGEYISFLKSYKDRLPDATMDVFTHWDAFYDAALKQMPDLIILDMRFDEITRDQLYGDIEALANTEHFCGNTERAEAQVRGMQGLLISRAIREHNIQVPIILFASLAPNVEKHVMETLRPISIIKGLILDEIIKAIHEMVTV